MIKCSVDKGFTTYMFDMNAALCIHIHRGAQGCTEVLSTTIGYKHRGVEPELMKDAEKCSQNYGYNSLFCPDSGQEMGTKITKPNQNTAEKNLVTHYAIFIPPPCR